MPSGNESYPRYVLRDRDMRIVAAARLLLAKLAKSRLVRPTQLATVSRLQHAMDQLPNAIDDHAVKVSVTGPRRNFGEIETYHWWEISTQDRECVITSAGHFYRPSTGGDSFVSMVWRVRPGEVATLDDYLDRLRIVPDAMPFEEEIAGIDFAEAQYTVEVENSDDALLDEEADNAADEEEDEEEEDRHPACVVSPSGTDEIELARKIDPAIVDAQDAQFAYGVEKCDFCKVSMEKCGLFVDGQVRNDRQWANMCAPCFLAKGAGIGWGVGQLYARQPNGAWRMVGGFERV